LVKVCFSREGCFRFEGRNLSPMSVMDKARDSCFKEQGWFRISSCLLGYQRVYRDCLEGDVMTVCRAATLERLKTCICQELI